MLIKWIPKLLFLFWWMKTMEAKQIDVRLLKSPEGVTTRSGEFLELRCEFSTAVNCLWMRHGQPLEINTRYQYLGDHFGYNTSDCSIRIGPTKKIDYDDWSCENTVTNGDQPVKSKTIKITEHISSEILVFHNNSLVVLNKIELIRGNEVTIQCSSSVNKSSAYRWETCEQNSTIKNCMVVSSGRNISLTEFFVNKWIRCATNESGSWVTTGEYLIVLKEAITFQEYAGNGYFIASCVLIVIVSIMMIVCVTLIVRFRKDNRGHLKSNFEIAKNKPSDIESCSGKNKRPTSSTAKDEDSTTSLVSSTQSSNDSIHASESDRRQRLSL